MINVSNEIKQAYDESTTQIDKIIVDNQEYMIMNVEYYDDTYEEGNIFGTAIARCLDFEIENTVDLENKEFEYQTGILVNGAIQWISLGKFIVESIEPNDTTNINKVTSMDYMLKTNIPYESNLDYSGGQVRLVDVLQEVCTNSGLQLATILFTNSNFIVTTNQFEEGTINRQVIQAVAQISGTVAKIKSDNKLYLINPNNVTTISKVFTLNNYQDAEIKRNTHPINSVTLGMSDVEGENVALKDEQSIEEDGENSLVINDNPFAYTQAKREELITALFNAVKGFEYKAYTLNCQGLPYLETIDKIQFKDKEGNTYDSYLFRFNYKSPNGLESTMEAPSIIKATVNYQNVADALEVARRTELMVDKQNQTIEGVIENVTAQNIQISQVTQTVNELNSKISEVADITTSQESQNGTVSLTNINQSEPIYIKIYPRIENISYIYPHSKLYPSPNLYPRGRTLRFENTETNEVFDYLLPANLLFYDSENYDEFILDYDSQTCVVNKKVGYNSDGTTYLLDNPQTINYDYPSILLTDGNYTVTILGYPNAYLFVRLMSQNIYTTQFATRAELNSAISQTVSEINLNVNQKLLGYPTTEEMYAAINISVNEISLEVSSKVGKDEIISSINQTAEAIKINANKINLSANDVLNILAGNQINLTTGNITINSDNFKVTKNGQITCTAGNIGGFTLGSTSFSSNFSGIYDYTYYELKLVQGDILGRIEIPYFLRDALDVNNDNNITSADYMMIKNILSGTSQNSKTVSGSLMINTKDPKNNIVIKKDGTTTVSIGAVGIDTVALSSEIIVCGSKTGTESSDFDGVLMDGNSVNMSFLYSGVTNITLDGSNGTIETTGSITIGENLFVDNGRIRSQYTYDNENVTNNPNVYITSGGNFRRTTGSSQRWKKDITENIEERLNPNALYNLPIKQFKYKDNIISENDARYEQNILGFIAEDVAEIYEPAVQYDEKGQVEMWNAQVIIPAMLKLVQDLKKRVDVIESEVS